MTVKEIADFTGKTDRTVRNWIKKAATQNGIILEKISNAYESKIPSDYTVDEVDLILKSGSLSKDAVNILMENARKQQPVEISQTQNMMAFMLKMQEQQNQFMTAVLNKLDGITQPPQQPQKALPYVPEITDRVRVKNLVNAYTVKTGGEFRDTWNMLYKEFNDRHHMNIHQRAYNSNVLIIDAVDSLGMMPDLLALANVIFANDFLIETE